ncbi:MAG: NAD-dependent epimerase/dehydratase family protein, partial [Burkholderiales bacterium]
AEMRYQEAESRLLPPTHDGVVLVTGGTGMLGRKTVEELRHAGHRMRVRKTGMVLRPILREIIVAS